MWVGLVMAVGIGRISILSHITVIFPSLTLIVTLIVVGGPSGEEALIVGSIFMHGAVVGLRVQMGATSISAFMASKGPIH